MIQSEKVGNSHLRNSLDKVLDIQRQKVREITEEQFIKNRDSVLTKISEKAKNQKEDKEKMYSNGISQHRY